MREGHDAGHVADRPDAVGCAAPAVDLDALRAEGDVEALESDLFHARRATDCDQQLLLGDLAPVLEAYDAASAPCGDLRRADPQSHRDTLLLEILPNQLPDRRVLARQRTVGRLHDSDRGPEAAQELAELDSDRPATQHDDAVRDLI